MCVLGVLVHPVPCSLCPPLALSTTSTRLSSSGCHLPSSKAYWSFVAALIVSGSSRTLSLYPGGTRGVHVLCSTASAAGFTWLFGNSSFSPHSRATVAIFVLWGGWKQGVSAEGYDHCKPNLNQWVHVVSCWWSSISVSIKADARECSGERRKGEKGEAIRRRTTTGSILVTGNRL